MVPAPSGHRSALLRPWPLLPMLFALLAALASGAGPAAAQVAAQAASLEILVTSRETRQPLAGARVTVPGTQVANLTDATGHLLVTGIPAGRHRVVVSLLGHDTAAVDVEFSAGARVQLQVPLTIRPVALEGVEVTGEAAEPRVPRLERAGFYHRQRTGYGSFLPPAEVAEFRQRSSALSDLLRQTRGIQLQPLNGGGFVAYASRPSGISRQPCPMPVYVDGLRQHFDRIDSNIDRLIPLQEVDAIEVYAGRTDTPLEFQYGRVCGAIVIWTRAGEK